jgi:hypothetical protein
MPLIHRPHIADPDAFYEELVACLEEVPEDRTDKLLDKLVLILANHIGDREVLSEALILARANTDQALF